MNFSTLHPLYPMKPPIYQPFFRKTELDKHDLLPFFEKTLGGLEQELSMIHSTMVGKEDSPFDWNETAWVGLLNNAIVRSYQAQVTTIQEYALTKGKGEKGRADLLVALKESEKVKYLLFEAKWWIENKKDLEGEMDYTNILRQAETYAKAESKFYQRKNLYLVAIVFGWLNTPEKVAIAERYMNHWDENDENETHFCGLYHDKKRGVWIYGKVLPFSSAAS